MINNTMNSTLRAMRSLPAGFALEKITPSHARAQDGVVHFHTPNAVYDDAQTQVSGVYSRSYWDGIDSFSQTFILPGSYSSYKTGDQEPQEVGSFNTVHMEVSRLTNAVQACSLASVAMLSPDSVSRVEFPEGDVPFIMSELMDRILANKVNALMGKVFQAVEIPA